MLNQAYVYSHVGRGPEPWGSQINNTHKYVIAFSLEMNYDCVEAAPRLPITEESAKQYLQQALVSLALAEYIRRLGYPARAHISGSNYQIMLPPVAYDAGLGELGRHGYLISPKYGARIRLGAVTTDLPLLTDRPINFGVQDFCEKCLRCTINCPSASIPDGGKTDIRGVEKWPLNVESCMMYWRAIGTDCGLCMKVCPFSHPPSMIHNLIRTGIKRSCFARTISVYGEDLFYGKKVIF
jgi:reductive dehalogenase